jgi:hypothetical protein
VLQVCTPRLRDPGSGSQPGARTRVSAAENIPPVPESYGGEGANELAAVIIKEVARAPSLLIAPVNRLGTVPVLLPALEDLKRKCLPLVARGDALFSTPHPEAGAGSDAAGMKTRAVRDGDWWVLNACRGNYADELTRRVGSEECSIPDGRGAGCSRGYCAALGRPRLHRDVTSASAGVAMICTVLAPLHAALPKIWRNYVGIAVPALPSGEGERSSGCGHTAREGASSRT